MKHSDNRVHIIGAGFSGLTAAYYLHRAGWQPELFEQSSRAGGLINTLKQPQGLVETAANAFISSAPLERLCDDLKVELVSTLPSSRHRYIYRHRPRRWPLQAGETLAMAGTLAWQTLRGKLRPQAGQTTREWGQASLGQAASDWLLAPALQGIYAGDFDQLSASLIIGKRWQQKTVHEKPQHRGSVAPREGMQQLIEALLSYCQQHQIAVHLNTPYPTIRDQLLPRVIATPLSAVSDLLAEINPAVAQQLATTEMREVTTVTAFYPHQQQLPRGFGCLIPRQLGYRTRGVLFNHCIFPQRSELRSETWIMEGMSHRAASEVQDQLASERAALFAITQQPVNLTVTQWPQAFPHYDITLEKLLQQQPQQALLPQKIVLHGNYLGRLGLADILQQSAELPQRLLQLA